MGNGQWILLLSSCIYLWIKELLEQQTSVLQYLPLHPQLTSGSKQD